MSLEVARHTIFGHSLLFKDIFKKTRWVSITFAFLAQSIFHAHDTLSKTEIIILVIILWVVQ